VREDQGEPDAPLFLVVHNDGGPVSAVSFHPMGDDRAIVTIIVAPHARRRGVATATLVALRDTFPQVAEITAYVDPENASSQKLLASLGSGRVPVGRAQSECRVGPDPSACYGRPASPAPRRRLTVAMGESHN
jgi:RimJ/RimL family protein N-acetyltransferase